jgi:hypothetical protein
VAPDVEEKLIENLQKVATLNFVPAPRETVDRVLDAEKLTRKALLPGGSAEPDLVKKVTEKLAAALEVQGFLIAVLPGEKLQRTAVLHLLAAGNTVPDTWDVSFGESASYMRFLSAVDRKATLYRPWTGLITVDSAMFEGVPVLRVVPGSPAAQAGVQPAEVLAAVDGKSVKQTSTCWPPWTPRRPRTSSASSSRARAARRGPWTSPSPTRPRRSRSTIRRSSTTR